jgi:hypothetical protein
MPGNAAQIDYWNAAAGDTWARLQELLDRQIAPLGHEAVEAASPFLPPSAPADAAQMRR